MITYMACAKANLVCAPVNLGLKPHEMAYCLKDRGARVLIVEETVAIPAIMTGGKLVMTKGFDAKECARLIEEHSIYMFVFLPMMYQAVLADPEARSRDFLSVRRAFYAMAPMAEPVLKKVHELFPNADVILGSDQTEFTP